MRIMLSHFTNDNGIEVWQVVCNGTVYTKELTDAAIAWDNVKALARMYPHAVLFQWDGDKQTSSDMVPIALAIGRMGV